jgi:hypothetical protein
MTPLPLADKDNGLGTEHWNWRRAKHRGYFVLLKSPFCRGGVRDGLGFYTSKNAATPALIAE